MKETGDLFFAWSDEPWVVEGADVRISIVGQDDGSEVERSLDGKRVAWLILAHKNLDSAVCAAYGWPVDIAEPVLLSALLKLNRIRAAQATNERLRGTGPQSGVLFKHMAVTLKPEPGPTSAPRRKMPVLAAAEKAASYGPRKPPKSAPRGSRKGKRTAGGRDA